MNEITVKVTKYNDRKHLVMHYRCPETLKLVTRSAKTAVKRDAEREAARWEAALRSGKGRKEVRTDWESFREKYESEAVPRLAAKTAARISTLAAKLREDGKSSATIAAYLRHLRSALNWAHEMELLTAVPKITMPPRVKGGKVMKGRPITTEEFERMAEKAASVVGDAAAPSWHYLLEGLWLSGLRLGEALDLWWDRDDKIRVDFSGKRPMMHIRAELEKRQSGSRSPNHTRFCRVPLAHAR
jgi:integrase